MSRRAARRPRKKAFKYKSLARSLGVFILFFISASVLVGVLAYKNITHSLTFAVSNVELISGRSELSKQDLTTVLYLSVEDINSSPVIVNNIIISFLDKDNKKVVSYNIPTSITLDVPGKFGNEELSKVVALGTLDGEGDVKDGVNLLRKSLIKIFGYNIDRYILVDKSLDPELNNFFSTAQIKPESLRKLKDFMVTDLNLKDLYDIYKFMTSLPEDRVILVNLSPSYVENPQLIDESIKDLTFDSAVAQEKKSIAILNGSGVSGIASFSSRILENMGGRVIAVENARNVYEKSILVVDNPNSETVKQIQEFFGFTQILVKGTDEIDLDENTLDRADITLIIGIDMGNSL